MSLDTGKTILKNILLGCIDKKNACTYISSEVDLKYLEDYTNILELFINLCGRKISSIIYKLLEDFDISKKSRFLMSSLTSSINKFADDFFDSSKDIDFNKYKHYLILICYIGKCYKEKI